ncbi:MAG: YbhB/YbcL family Raf kinase inhibitor-like protein [Candidatus Omnitrophota bacterium]
MKFISLLFLAVFFFTSSVSALELRSDAFEDGEFIPERYTCKGEDVSPSLSWSGVPKGTKSFVLIMDDPDAPFGTWIHWVIYNIPADTTSFEEGVPNELVLEGGMKQGINSWRRAGYGGPCPPPGPAHRYIFKLYAVDTVPDLLPAATKRAVLQAIQGHILEMAQLIGLFKR